METITSTYQPVGGKVQVWAQRDPRHDRVKVFITRYEPAREMNAEGVFVRRWRSENLTMEGWVAYGPHEEVEPIVTLPCAELVGGDYDPLLADIRGLLASAVPSFATDEQGMK